MRSLDNNQKQLLNAILAFPFEGKEKVIEASRLDEADVLDPYGSLGFFPPGDPRWKKPCSAPLTVAWNDVDGIPVEFIVLLAGGVLSELCIFKVDGSAIEGKIDPSALYVPDIPLTDDTGRSSTQPGQS